MTVILGTKWMRMRFLKTFSPPVKCPGPLTNRDFVNQRSWRFFGDEYIIFNHSIPYKVGVRGCTWVVKCSAWCMLILNRRGQ